MRVLPPFTTDFRVWAENLRRYLASALNQLDTRDTYSSASEDGILLWDRSGGYPVVSKDGEWRQIILEDGSANLYIPSDVVAAAANTAYPLTFTIGEAHGISLGTPASRVVFSEPGEYMLSFTAQISSTNSSQVNFWFWPRLNGTDIPTSAMQTSLSSNGSTNVVARTSNFHVSAGDYIEAYWAVSDVTGYLHAHTATAFSPSTPAATLAISRVHG